MLIRFAETIDTSTTKVITKRIASKGTLKNLYCRFYGSKKLLKVSPFIIFKGTEVSTPIITYLGDEVALSGDFEEFDERLNIELQPGDVIKLVAENLDASVVHSLNVNMNIVEG